MRTKNIIDSLYSNPFTFHLICKMRRCGEKMYGFEMMMMIFDDEVSGGKRALCCGVLVKSVQSIKREPLMILKVK